MANMADHKGDRAATAPLEEDRKVTGERSPRRVHLVRRFLWPYDPLHLVEDRTRVKAYFLQHWALKVFNAPGDEVYFELGLDVRHYETSWKQSKTLEGKITWDDMIGNSLMLDEEIVNAGTSRPSHVASSA